MCEEGEDGREEGRKRGEGRKGKGAAMLCGAVRKGNVVQPHLRDLEREAGGKKGMRRRMYGACIFSSLYASHGVTKLRELMGGRSKGNGEGPRRRRKGENKRGTDANRL